MVDSLYDRLVSALTDEELERYDIHFSVEDGIPHLKVYEVEENE